MNWYPGGLLAIPPEAKLPNSQRLLMSLQRSGYLTATTEWYVIGLTRELEGSISPQAWMSLTPAVWELSSAWISPAIGRRVSACCSIQASPANPGGYRISQNLTESHRISVEEMDRKCGAKAWCHLTEQLWSPHFPGPGSWNISNIPCQHKMTQIDSASFIARHGS